MSKILLLIVLCCLCWVHCQGQALTDREYCNRLTRECLRSEGTVGPNDDTVGIYNDWCRRSNRNWRNITRCQLVRASCELTLIRCANLSCQNVLAVLL
ncbi:uncharacterized protein Dwil_GK27973 [Drosophila willistoni]|uniref:Uncharacterized protein n=1 Tax=Drosophila willistoni TaxID=7260 RepID=A0A0Q9X1D0_DROWI|nr:uncharacterized protein Dwil_GK27973 [Drosophila willistoni]